MVAQFAALTLTRPVGLAVHAVGASTEATFGALVTAPAWSSIKVPLSVAALRAHPGSTGTASLIRRAITVSDNQAAEGLWAGLGSGEPAAAQVQNVLRESNDVQTVVQAVRIRPEYTPFGQTMWSVTDSARYVAAVPCSRASLPVLDLMSQIDSSQRWGLGRIRGASFKGGWVRRRRATW